MLNCHSFLFSRHAILQMFARGISSEDVTKTCSNGEIVEIYDDDKPFPSLLVLGQANGKTLHVVVAQNKKIHECIIVTTYDPDPKIWDKGFKTRKMK